MIKTKADLIEFLENYPDDIRITVGPCSDDLVISECIGYAGITLNFNGDFDDE
jgi:hypothetical protein